MKILHWDALTQEEKNIALARPAILESAAITKSVKKIIHEVRAGGDLALIKLTEQFDNCSLTRIQVSQEEIDIAHARINEDIKKALDKAYDNIYAFHFAQKTPPLSIETMPGVLCELIDRPVCRVGLYIPGGSTPLPSTALMLGIPAQIAGCKKVVLCSPPPICDEILYVAKRCGIDEIYNLGGAQAIAAMAYGTQSVSKVDKIFGPGNAFVTEAKQQVSLDFQGAAIDMPAGPSELLIIADEHADPDFIAADLLSQAEHGPDSQVFLVTASKNLGERVAKAVEIQIQALPRLNIAQKALDSSLIIIAEDLQQCIDISNDYAPEHLIIQTQLPRALLPLLDNAGSVFLGAFSPESVGDYASGTNHVLPTYGFTRTCSSLGLADFKKRMTVQELSPEGLQAIASTVISIAETEHLQAHKNAVSVRIKKLTHI